MLKLIQAVMLFFLLPFWLLGCSDSSISNPSDCSPLHLNQVDRCHGHSEPGWMNSGNYQVEAVGKINPKICQAFLEPLHEADFEPPNIVNMTIEQDTKACDIDSPEQWEWVTSPWPRAKSNEFCFQCNGLLSNGNNQRYRVLGFSKDCTIGQYYSSFGIHPAKHFSVEEETK